MALAATEQERIAPARGRARVAPRLALAAVVVAYLGLGALYNVTNPIWEAPDEPAHYLYAAHVAETGTLPIREVQAGDQYHQPPLYYLLGGAAIAWLELDEDVPAKFNRYFIWSGDRLGDEINAAVHTLDELPPYQGTVLAVHLLRLLSTVFGAVAVLAVYLVGRTLLPSRPWLAVAAAGFTAFTPQFLFVTASVGNDGPAIAFGSLVMLWIVTAIATARRGDRLSYRRFAALGLLLGLGLLSKLTFYSVLPVLAVAACYLLVATPERGRLLGGWVLAGAITFGLAGWWYFRNVIVYATGYAFFGQGRLNQRTLPEIVEKPDEVAAALQWYPEPLFQSFWLRFGWMNVSPEPWVYQAAMVASGVALAGCLIYTIRQSSPAWREQQVDNLGLSLCALALFSALAIITWRFAYTLGNHFPQGRYLYVVQPAIATLFVLGLAEVGRLPMLAVARSAGVTVARLQRMGAAPAALGLVAIMLLFAAAAPFRYIAPAYETKPIWLTFDQATLANRTDAVFADRVGLAGFEIVGGDAKPGGSLVIDLYWRSLSPVDKDLQVFVHLADETFRPLAQDDGPLGGTVYPSSRWEPGEVIVDERQVRIADDVPAGRYQLLVGIYDLDTGQRLALTAPAGGDSFLLTTLRIDGG